MDFVKSWSFGSPDPENARNLEVIAQWWARLAGKEVSWKQRLIPEGDDLERIDWGPQRFDERFVLLEPQVRGAIFVWRTPEATNERTTKVRKVQLDTLHHHLTFFPKNQQDLVLRVALPQGEQAIELRDPVWSYETHGETHVLTVNDTDKGLEIRVVMSGENFMGLMDKLSQ